MSQQIDSTPPSTREPEAPVSTTIGNWQLGGDGYLRYLLTGYKAFRIDSDGTIWIWDKWARDASGERKPCERPLTMTELAQFVFQQAHTGGEP